MAPQDFYTLVQPAGIGDTFVVDKAGLAVNDLITVSRTGEMVKVLSVAADTVTAKVKRGLGGTGGDKCPRCGQKVPGATPVEAGAGEGLVRVGTAT